MFREVNERIIELSKSWSAEPQFVCECESTDCAETIFVLTGDSQKAFVDWSGASAPQSTRK